MKSKYLALVAAATLALAGCSKQSDESEQARTQAQLKPTVVEKKVSNPKSSSTEVDAYCYATDIACYLFKAAYGRLTEPSLKIRFHYQIAGPSGLGGRVYYTLLEQDKALAEQWLKDLNTQNNGYSWANSLDQASQWLESRKIKLSAFLEKLEEFEKSKQYEKLVETQNKMAVGAWPFFVRGSDSKLLSQINRLELLEESSMPAK